MVKYCRSCGFLDQANLMCGLTGSAVSDPSAEFCSKHNHNPLTCAICNRFAPPEATVIMENDDVICFECYSHRGTCAICANAIGCEYETNPSPLPKVIQRTVQKGNMITVINVKNPTRIEETCKKGCSCFSEEFGCLRENNHCGAYKYITAEKFHEVRQTQKI